MTPEDTAEVLKMAARFDRRTVGAEDIALWCAVLTRENVTRQQAINAIVDHYTRRPDDYLKIGHIVQGVKRERSQGLAKSAALVYQALAEVDPDAPDHTSRTLSAIRSACAQAGQAGTQAAERLALTSGYAMDWERGEASDRDHRRQARDVIAQKIKDRPPIIDGEVIHPRETDNRVSPNVAAARERAAREKRAPAATVEPMQIGRTLRQVVRR